MENIEKTNITEVSKEKRRYKRKLWGFDIASIIVLIFGVLGTFPFVELLIETNMIINADDFGLGSLIGLLGLFVVPLAAFFSGSLSFWLF